jgi:type IV pilus assembly protein PilC
MPKYNYVALDAKGKEITGVLDSENTTTAVAKIREMGYFPTNLAEADKPKKAGKDAAPAPAQAGGKPQKKKAGSLEIKLPGSGKVKSKVLTTFTRQLATLIDAGLPLLRGLSVLGKQEKNPTLKKTLGQLADSVEAGSTFSEGLSQHPKIFNKLYINMVRAGEAGGVLDVTLNRLSEFMEKAEKIKGKIVGAMVYPAVIMVVALSILSFLMIVIVPKFAEIFDSMLEGGKLPALTRFVMGISNIMSHNAHYIVLAVIAIIVAYKMVNKNPAGRLAIDKVKINAPIFGPLIRKIGIGRFSRTLGTLIASGVPILQALNIVRETAGNSVIANAVALIHDSVKEGERIVQPMEASKVFPPMVVSMVDVGEETGALPDMLTKVADVYDDEVDNAVGALTSMIEPIMIVFLAVMVGTIVIALFLPLIELMNKLGG